LQVEESSDKRIQEIGDAWLSKKSEFEEVHTLKSNTNISAMRAASEKTDMTRIIRNFKLLCWRTFAEQVNPFS
jgi:hypothetical protein